MQLEGQVKSIIFRNDQNGYTVLSFVDDAGEEHTAVGGMPIASVGERIELTGDWTEHPTYGRQFRAEECRTLAPSSQGALISYLGSGLIRGVGESTARAIVALFGMDALEIMEERPERLLEVPGIGKKRAAMIAESYTQQRDMRDIMLALQSYDITIGQAMKLYNIYGPLCLNRIQENPYRLIEDVDTIGFKTADKIARSAGIEEDSPFRLKAGIKYTMQRAVRDGHTFLPREKLIEVAAAELGAEVGPVERELDELIVGGELLYKLVGSTDGVFLPYMFYVEGYCAHRLTELAKPPNEAPFYDVETRISRLERELHVELASEQRRAVVTALKSGAMVITGGPGTGKTTILQFIIRIVEELGLDFELCAPTGRAAKRMSEATGYDARTIHRLLEYGFAGDSFAKNEEDPITADIVIVDEMSMVDALLMQALLKAIGAGTRLIMVGDADQLPPVGPGNILKDIIESGELPVICLSEIYRQTGRSMIVYNAHRINDGGAPVLDNSSDDFMFESIPEAETVVQRVIALCEAGRTAGASGAFADVQVLVPMKKGALGVYALNARLQQALNPPGGGRRERKYGDTVFREGDKVMQIKNNYRTEWSRTHIGGGGVENGRGVFNGDMGTVLRIDAVEQTVTVLFDDERCAAYDPSMLEELELAYCISIHKSQGSEFKRVVLPLLAGPRILMTRNLLYTAVTRARSQVYILGSAGTVQGMVQNNLTRLRYSALKHMLMQLAEPYA